MSAASWSMARCWPIPHPASGCRPNDGAWDWCFRTRGCFRICRWRPICASVCVAPRAGPVRFDEVVELLGIAALLARRPHTLSGGERQRVAIGRALLAQPHLLLMDEPLASLDSARKAEIMPYLTRLKTALKLPILYVTHALDEVAQLADSMVLIEAGRVIGSGPLSEIAARADLPLAQRDDAGALLLCRVVEHDDGARAVAPGGRRRDVLGAAAGRAARCRTAACAFRRAR